MRERETEKDGENRHRSLVIHRTGRCRFCCASFVCMSKWPSALYFCVFLFIFFLFIFVDNLLCNALCHLDNVQLHYAFACPSFIKNRTRFIVCRSKSTRAKLLFEHKEQLEKKYDAFEKE